jgi:hypothetical protein
MREHVECMHSPKMLLDKRCAAKKFSAGATIALEETITAPDMKLRPSMGVFREFPAQQA